MSKAKRLVFLFKQVTVRYPRATNSESDHDGRFRCTDSHLVLSLEVFHRVCFWFHCSRVPARLCQCT